jgi:hypothetical protein
MTKLGQNLTRVAIHPRHQCDRRVVVAEFRSIIRRLRRFAEAVVFTIAANTDDLPVRLVWSLRIETPSDRILTGEEFVRESFIHNRDAVFELVLVRKEIAAAHRNFHRLEVIG